MELLFTSLRIVKNGFRTQTTKSSVVWRLNIIRIAEYGAEVNEFSIYKTNFLENKRDIWGHSYRLAEWKN